MKIHLHVGQSPINGYNNIDLISNSINLEELNSICEASECTQMILNNILGYIHFEQIPKLLTKLITRIRLKGSIIIHDINFISFLNGYINGIIDLKDLNNVLFGMGQVKKCSCFSVNDIENIIKVCGLHIESLEINEGKFILIGKRNL